MCGDFWQLAPPDGSFLGTIPEEFISNSRKFRPAPTVAHGQSLLWGGPNIGVQGVTELEEYERCDVWLEEVHDEFRHGCLSDDTNRFLHGKPPVFLGVGNQDLRRVETKNVKNPQKH